MMNSFLNGEDILVVTAGYWDTAKRIRHKMPMQWARAGSRILWIEQSPFPDAAWFKPDVLAKSVTGDLREVEPRLFVASMPLAVPCMYRSGVLGDVLKAIQRPLYFRRLRHYLAKLNFKPKIVVLFQQAARMDVFDYFKDCIKIYYNHDVYGYGYATPIQEKTLELCCKKADIVWCTAKEHLEMLIPYNSNTHFIPHAVDEEWFNTYRTVTPIEYQKIQKPRLVYTGVFQEKVDIPLLIEIATRKPDLQLVFVGPVEPKNLDRSLIEKLQSYPNAHFLGERDVNELPGFIEGASILMLPYLPTNNMKSTGLSLKFYEYLISGKPIIISPFTKMQVSDRFYYAASGADEWVTKIEELENGDGKIKSKERIAFAMDNTYSARIKIQQQLLEPFFKIQ